MSKYTELIPVVFQLVNFKVEAREMLNLVNGLFCFREKIISGYFGNKKRAENFISELGALKKTLEEDVSR